jgi:hypothetical protein
MRQQCGKTGRIRSPCEPAENDGACAAATTCGCIGAARSLGQCPLFPVLLLCLAEGAPASLRADGGAGLAAPSTSAAAWRGVWTRPLRCEGGGVGGGVVRLRGGAGGSKSRMPSQNEEEFGEHDQVMLNKYAGLNFRKKELLGLLKEQEEEVCVNSVYVYACVFCVCGELVSGCKWQCSFVCLCVLVSACILYHACMHACKRP